MIKVGFDSEIFSLQTTGGVSRYFASLIEEYYEDKSHGVLPQLTFKKSNNIYLAGIPRNGGNAISRMRFPYLPPTSPLRTLLTLGPIHQLLLTMAAEPKLKSNAKDIFHATYYRPTYLEKRNSRKLAVTVHDFIPEKLGWLGVKNPHIGKRKMTQRADLIFCVSRETAEDLKHFYGIDDDRVKVVGHGARFFNTVESKQASQNDIPTILYVGHRAGYKNFFVLMRALAELRKKSEFQFVTVGPEWSIEELSQWEDVGKQIPRR